VDFHNGIPFQIRRVLIPQSVAREFGLAKILANVETFRNDCERIDRDWGRSIAGKENGG
jgi:hypothetical protein